MDRVLDIPGALPGKVTRTDEIMWWEEKEKPGKIGLHVFGFTLNNYAIQEIITIWSNDIDYLRGLVQRYHTHGIWIDTEWYLVVRCWLENLAVEYDNNVPEDYEAAP